MNSIHNLARKGGETYGDIVPNDIRQVVLGLLNVLRQSTVHLLPKHETASERIPTILKCFTDTLALLRMLINPSKIRVSCVEPDVCVLHIRDLSQV